MDKYTRILSAVFLAVLGYVFVSSVVYPRWIDPLLRIDGQIAEKAEELTELERAQAEVDDAKTAYRQLAARVGSLDIGQVQNDIRSRLDALIGKNELEETKVTPRKAQTDSKTNLSRMSFQVTAEGTLKSVIAFLKDAAELPYLCRITNPKISPVSSSSKNKNKDLMSMKATVEVMVLPDQKVLPSSLKRVDLVQPERHQRHLGRDYAMIWEREPFFEYEKPRPARTERETRPDPEPEPDPGPVRWKDAANLKLHMAWLMYDGTTRFDEVMLYDTRSKEERYVRVGEEFDGGSLLYVHQRGVLVGRQDGEYVYPIGKTLSRPIKIEDAVDYPEFQLALERIQEAEEAKRDDGSHDPDSKRTAQAEAGEQRDQPSAPEPKMKLVSPAEGRKGRSKTTGAPTGNK